MYTIKQLKKMSSERLHKVFEKIVGYTLFNPYTERQFMIVMIYQVLNSNNYDWIFKMTPDYIYQKSVEIISQTIALPFLVKVESMLSNLAY